MWSLPLVLVGLLLFGTVMRFRAAAATAVLLVNWVLNTAVVRYTGDPYPWAWFLSVDWVSAVLLLVLFERPSVPSITISVLFALECLAHGVYGFSRQDGWSQYRYWYALHYMAWGQVWLVVGGMISDGARRAGFRWRRLPYLPARFARVDCIADEKAAL